MSLDYFFRVLNRERERARPLLTEEEVAAIQRGVARLRAREWAVCGRCSGDGKSDQRGPCGACKGAGVVEEGER